MLHQVTVSIKQSQGTQTDNRDHFQKSSEQMQQVLSDLSQFKEQVEELTQTLQKHKQHNKEMMQRLSSKSQTRMDFKKSAFLPKTEHLHLDPGIPEFVQIKKEDLKALYQNEGKASLKQKSRDAR